MRITTAFDARFCSCYGFSGGDSAKGLYSMAAEITVSVTVIFTLVGDPLAWVTIAIAPGMGLEQGSGKGVRCKGPG